MSRTARLWKGAGPSALAFLLVAGATAWAAEPPSLSEQLLGLGRQARAQGRSSEADGFFRQVLKLDPQNAEAKQALAKVRRVALQDAAPAQDKDAVPPAPAAPGDAQPAAPADVPAAPTAEQPAADVPPTPTPLPPKSATIERAAELQKVLEQQLTADVADRMQRARDLLNQGQPEGALETLRLALAAIRSAEQVSAAVRDRLDRQVQVQYQSTVRRQEEVELARADTLRQQAHAEQRERALAALSNNQDTANLLMVQFDTLMAAGQYNVMANGGLGDIGAATAPYYEARLTAQKARALEPNNPAPRAGVIMSQTVGFLAQALAFEELKQYRAMLTWQDVDRASVPFPDTQTIEYPPAEYFKRITEKRRQAYESVDLVDRDEQTKSILRKLDQRIPIQFPEETPLEDVLKYIKAATQGPNDTGIPIYVDPVGLQEAEKTMQSPVTLDLEGVPLKTTLKLVLKQLGLSYTVKDGLMTITSETSEDQPTEIRVYPVADLAIIPLSLMGGGGMMGGGMGGMGGGMGGMGGGMMGGMGGMGGGMMGGMGGMGGGMGGMGMMSVPAQDPNDDPSSAFLQKKSN